MPLEAGRQLGPYEILSAIGAGGMGEVYKARDPRLDRTVAIKVLPEHVAADPDLKQRFEREAKTISSLNHPHICTLYDIGSQDGIDFLVMEYLEGETLAQRLEKGALPLDQALKIAIEIADALDKAHRQGITHRDLKPGNIMITKAGTKLLDFGLAKLKQPAPGGAGATAVPTLSAGLTMQGTILGTLQYMAPEQLEGTEADARTDIFAFGAVVYEVATGKKAFEGKSQASLIGAILEREPTPISSLQPMSPPALDRVVSKCLAKDADRRWQTARDLHDELEWVATEERRDAVSASTRPLSGAARGLPALLAGLLVGGVVVGLTVWVVMRSGTAAPQSPMRFGINLPSDLELYFPTAGGDQAVALSPDGHTVVYAAERDGVSQLYRQELGELSAVPLAGTENGGSPTFSPNGQWVAFSTPGSFKRVPLNGGQALTMLTEVTTRPNTGSWGADDTLVFGESGSGTSIRQVGASGGVAQEITRRITDEGETDHRWPELLPGGDAFLFEVIYSTGRAPEIVVQSRETGERHPVIEGSSPRYVSTGHLVFTRAGSLWAAPFDLDRQQVTGTAQSMIDHVNSTGFAISDAGTLVYAPAQVVGGRALVWVDRDGTEQPLDVEPQQYRSVRLSPDGTQLLMAFPGSNPDIWLHDLEQGTSRPLTFDPAADSYPLWTPDGQRVVFSSGREGIRNLFWRRADGTGPVERLTDNENIQSPWSWSPHGEMLVFQQARGFGWDIHVLSMESGQSTVLLGADAVEVNAQISPDGKWIAYAANETGEMEVWLQPFPNVEDGRWQVSRGGGVAPRWSPDGRELYYRQSPQGSLMAVAVNADPTPSPGRRESLFEDTYFYAEAVRTYHVSPIDGRFLMMKDDATPEDTPATADLIVVLNWHEELKRLVPVD